MDLASLLHGAAPAPKLYTETYGKRSLQAPLSPPVEDQPKCSLPSISTLLEGAEHSAKRQRLSPPAHQRDARYDTICMPPTPPLRPGSGSGHSSISHSPVELNTPKHTSPHMHRSSISSTTSSTAPHHSHSHSHSHGPYASPAPSTSSTGSTYTSPVETNPPNNNTLYYPRPPSTTTFNPAPTTPALNTTNIPQSTHQQPQSATQQSPSALISPVTPAWQHQHHHYFPPSSAAPYQQNHDRYICRTCHKAFSRPSSLRIHSHSHTGEKPFHCTHPGCGKAFSVRSNMKRHERGCHSGRPAVPAPQALVS
ncbi:C2H2 finger domain transcription factor mtfA [Penicillium subrubescens]|uniref:Zinc finger protein C25B8.19c n=1 Tax=Penicillium subrubescens TaxID=1316194 RepID=A0A1Q5UMC7_9EURO|nr:C2H2 finger domain transcription factor mtfA [Penicillium subrubescens]KAJ5895842.1 C2H2 finger domain transcription factor mtfA [Penicillium subrubescens]OKP13622.1 Zinc finger protein C25B8.19c [Penicillium subrubescens]